MGFSKMAMENLCLVWQETISHVQLKCQDRSQLIKITIPVSASCFSLSYFPQQKNIDCSSLMAIMDLKIRVCVRFSVYLNFLTTLYTMNMIYLQKRLYYQKSSGLQTSESLGV